MISFSLSFEVGCTEVLDVSHFHPRLPPVVLDEAIRRQTDGIHAADFHLLVVYMFLLAVCHKGPTVENYFPKTTS